MAQQPSRKGKETAAPPEADDVEYPDEIIQSTNRQRILPALNMELGESSSSSISTRNTMNVGLGLSRRSLGQRRRRLRDEENALTSITPQCSTSIQSHEMGELPRNVRARVEPSINEQDTYPNSSNITLRSSRRGSAQRTRRLREQESKILEDHDISQQIFTQSRHSLGRMKIVCEHCDALHWIDEKLVRSSPNRPKFGTCCLEGQVKLPRLREPPTLFRSLYDGNDDSSTSFFHDIRQYNSANAFTSLGCAMDDRVLLSRGPYSFTIHGELRHRTGALLPQQGAEPVYAQLYIYDPTRALDSRQRRNPMLDRDLLGNIQECLLRNNPFVHLFRQAYEVLQQENQNQDDQNLPAYLHYDPRRDQRRYNAPIVDEIAVIVPGDGTEARRSRDIILHYKGTQGLTRISESHPAYAPLHYVLLFPFGELGWEPTMTLWDVDRNAPSTKQRNRLTMMDYYSYRLFERTSEYSTILRGRKLFQEFLVDAWAATEQNRLTFIRENQEFFIRFDRYRDLQEIFDEEGPSPDQIGRRFILPSSFIGGPRQMHEIFQDSMAITRAYKHPDIFLTMTANPAWPEIRDALLPNQTAADRPDLVARVFELKRRELMKIVKNKRVFGKIEAYVFTIEFQKRGLPHMHALFFLAEPDKIRTPEQVDRVVCAELPDRESKPALFDTITRCMIHGPCGTRNSSAQCMEKGFCKKKYPKSWAEATSIDNDGYAINRRRDNGVVVDVRGKEVDNRDVVPYNPYLSEMFNCHINVEVCAGLTCVKYIHKYIYKGHDRTTMVLGRGDEIKQYLDSRYIGPPEAAWRLLLV